MLEAGSVAVQIKAELAHFNRGLQEARAEAQRFDRTVQTHMRGTDRAMQQLGNSARQASAAIRIMTGAFAALGGAVAVRQLQQYADIWIRVQNQLKVAGLEGNALGDTLDELYAIAQRNGTAIEPLVTLYGRLAQAQKELGATGTELTRFTEGVSLALRVQGADAQSASGALLQLSQALGGAVVRAEEFNSINEGARPILQAVANGLEEAGGSVAKLRSLVIDGKVSSEAFFRAFLAGMGDLETQAAATEQTSSQAFAKIQNSLAKLVGEIDRNTEASKNFAEYMGRVADVLDWATTRVDPLSDKLRELQETFWIFEHLGFGGLVSGNWLGAVGTLFNATQALVKQAKEIEADVRTLGDPSLREPGDRVSIRTGSTVSLADFKLPGDDDVQKARERTDAYERATAAINDQIAALQLEAQIWGMTTAAQEAARIEQELLNAAREAGRTLTPEEAAAARSLAQGYGEAAEALESLRTAAEEAAEAQRFFTDTAYQGFADLIPPIETGIDALDRLIEKLAEAALQAALLGSGPLAGLFGGGGGILGALLPNAKGNVFSGGNVIPFARGGVVSSPTVFPMARGAGLMGEAGPEAIMPLRRDSSGRLGVIHAGGRDGGAATGPQHVDVNVNVSVSGARGNREIETMVATGVTQGLQAYDRALPAKVRGIAGTGLRRGDIR